MKKQIILVLSIVVILCSIFILNNNNKSERPILGVIIPLTGPVAPIAEGLKNTIDYIQLKNINIEYADDACDAKKALSAYQELKLKGVKVFYIACSSSILSIEPLAKQNGDLILTTYAFSSDIRDTGNDVIRFIPDSLDVFGSMKEYFSKHPSNSYAVLYENGTYQSLADNLSNLLKDKLIARESYNSDATDIRTQLIKIKNSGAENLIFLPVGDKLAKSVYENMKIQNMNIPIIGEFNLCNYTFKPSEFGLKSVCWKGQLDNVASQEFSKGYKLKYSIENQYPFFDQITYDVISISDKLMGDFGASDNKSIGRIKDKILSGVEGPITSYTFESNGKLKDGDKFLVEVAR